MPGVAINPSTPVSALSSVVDLVDLILVMTVNPGWGGQKFIQSSVSKLQDASSLISKSGRAIRLEVDGGIDAQTAPICAAAGVDTLVAGTYVFGSADYSRSISSLRV